MGNKGILINFILILIILNSYNLVSIDGLNLYDKTYQIHVTDKPLDFNYALNYHNIQKGGEFEITFTSGISNSPVAFQYDTKFPIVSQSDYNNVHIGNTFVNGIIYSNSIVSISHKINRCLSANQEIPFEFSMLYGGSADVFLRILILNRGGTSCTPLSTTTSMNSTFPNFSFPNILNALIIFSGLTVISIVAIIEHKLSQKEKRVTDELYPENK